MALQNAFENVATESTLQKVADRDIGLIERIVLKILSRFTFSTSGVRVDASGSAALGVGTVTTVTTVTTVGAANNVSLGRFTTDGMSIQQTQLNYNCGFRRNITVS